MEKPPGLYSALSILFLLTPVTVFFLPLIYLKIKNKKATGLTSKNVAGIQSSSRHKRDTLLHLPHSALLTSVWQKQQKHNDVIHSYH